MAKKSKEFSVDGGALRFNKNKIDPTYCSASVINAIALVFMKNSEKFGGKYPDANWRRGMKASKWLPSAFRHVLALSEGVWIDEEDGIPHLWHLAACAAIGIESSLVDDQNFDKLDFEKSMQVFKSQYADIIKSLFQGVQVDENRSGRTKKRSGKSKTKKQDINKKGNKTTRRKR